MLGAPIPENDAARLAELRRYGVLDTPEEHAFERVIALTSRMLGVPIALVSLIDENRQWFKACIGLDTRETSREISFCGHAIASSTPLIIGDALLDPRFADNPLVTGPPHIRAYVGAPLVTPSGFKLGTLCAIDTRPRSFTLAELRMLGDLAAIVVDELELRLARDEQAAQHAELQRVFDVQREQAEALSAQTRVLLAILDSAGEGIAVTDDESRFVFFNPAAERILGYAANDAAARQALGQRYLFRPDGVTPFPADELPARRVLLGEYASGIEMCIRRPDAPDTHISVTGRPILDDNQTISGSVITFADITALHLAREELSRQATTDVLTGIANHRAFRQRLELLVAEGRRGRHFALVMCDVDHFKRFNDEHGHPMGDRVLAAVAAKLAARVRKTDLAARYGGEEFAVLLSDVDGEHARVIAEELRSGIAALELPHRVTASFGVAPYVQPMDAGALIAHADAALYRAKRTGRDRVELAE